MAVNRQPVVATSDEASTTPRWPEVRPVDIVLGYDALPLDTLHVQFGTAPAPGYYVPVELERPRTDGLMVIVAMDRSIVVGFMIEGFLTWVEHRPLEWLAVASFAGVPQSMFPDSERMAGHLVGRDQAVIDLLDGVRSAWAIYLGKQTGG